MRVGILALQGAFIEHASVLERLNVQHFEIRQKKDLLQSFDGLILPGGESTVMRKLLLDLGLFQPLSEQIQQGLPVFGTCAGLILLANEVEEGNSHLGTMDICVRRNAYGRRKPLFRHDGYCSQTQCLRAAVGQLLHRGGMQRYRHGPHDLYPGAVHLLGFFGCRGAGGGGRKDRGRPSEKSVGHGLSSGTVQ